MHQDDMTSEKEQPREDTALSAEEWKRKYAELEVQLTEKEADLHLKSRELEIEAALERVRARTMGMQHSSELTEISFLLVKQVLELGVNTWGCAFNIFDEDQPSSSEWFSNEQGYKSTYKIPREGVFLRYYEAAQRGESLHVEEFRGDVCIEHYRYLSTLPGLDEEMRIYAKDGIPLPTVQFDNVTYFKYGYLLFVTYEDVPEAHDIFKRFAKVFEQTYTRFLDLQKAEAQAREAQIETALERVRSRAMAMHKSDELLEVIAIVAEQLKHLNFRFDNVSFAVRNQTHDYKFWLSSPGLPKPIHIHVPYTNNPMFERVRDVPDQNLGIYTDILTTKENRQWHEHVFENSELHNLPAKTKKYILDHGYARTIILMPTIMLIIGNYASKPYTEEENNVFKRFAGVFEQSYTRFLDLQKAEAQAREAKIEAALERIRSRTMGMQNSEELSEVIHVIYEQFLVLNFEISNAGFLMDYRESNDFNVWMADALTDTPTKQCIPYFDHPFNRDYLEQKENGPELFTKVYSFEEKNSWLENLYKHLPWIPEELKVPLLNTQALAISRILLKNIGLYLFNYNATPYTNAENTVLIRIGKVFEQTYIRFNDLKLAEAQAREAQIETALERIRAKALAMHQSDELMEVALTLREQMGLLGQKELEASVIHFYNLKKETIQSWHVLNTPGSEKGNLSAGSFEIRKNTCQLTQQFFTEFQSEKTEYSFIVEREVLWEWLEYLESIAPEIKESIKGRKPEKAFYHFSKFTDGALLMVSSTPPTEESKYLQKRAAQVFELAYKRYLDLKQTEKLARKAELDLIRLKVEKAKTEEALKELKATQNQLVQQEKLASLGQLTAGIAHEIKNPLNFVTNFSEVSVELVEEAREELRQMTDDRGPENSPLALASRDLGEGSAEAARRRGVSDEAQNPALLIEILDDIEMNLRKIHDHGSRADGIVKSMLQHSRGGSGKMEPTPLNPLIKEYVNLAFHGMRAGKGPIDVDIDLQLDEQVGDVPLVAEDFSRVILNLCNNAFDAMREKDLSPNPSPEGEGRRGEGKYSPKLTVQTEKKDGAVTIEIEDNGPGIPDDIKDKILQPFFTTKKGTQGTGLGLSITNDIVKAHGGEMQIVSQPGSTVFSIRLNQK
jgi:signal transduction histidine kinase